MMCAVAMLCGAGGCISPVHEPAEYSILFGLGVGDKAVSAGWDACPVMYLFPFFTGGKLLRFGRSELCGVARPPAGKDARQEERGGKRVLSQPQPFTVQYCERIPAVAERSCFRKPVSFLTDSSTTSEPTQ